LLMMIIGATRWTETTIKAITVRIGKAAHPNLLIKSRALRLVVIAPNSWRLSLAELVLTEP
jgi:hypothetical protein